MKNNIIFIHGMFQNGKSWDGWVKYFTAKGYNCVVESWPLHEGEPKDLRDDPPIGLGDLHLQEVIDKYASLITTTDSEAILIGHSVGGLIVQALINKGIGSMGICISSVAPNKMLSFDWGFFKNSISISNPFKGDEPFYMTPEGFHKSFCNTMSKTESNIAYERTALHDSRNMLRDCLMEAGEIDFEKTYKPLLFIGGEKDQIIPPELNKRNAQAYKENLSEFIEFSNRGHFICGQPGWEDVVRATEQWISKQKVSEQSLTY